MAEFQNFRSALGGFNREDVVHYIEYINNKHAAQLNQLKTEVQTLQAELADLRRISREEFSQAMQLEEANAKIAQLEQELEAARSNPQEVAVQEEKPSDELEAYRRAERVERLANERVAQLYDQANAALAEAAARADESAIHVGDLSDALNQHVSQLLSAIASSKATMQDTTAALFAIRPLSSEEE